MIRITILLSCCFMFSLLIGFIYQTIVNHNLRNALSNDYDLLLESPINIGDDVYDLNSGLIGKYCGDYVDNNDTYCIVVYSVKENSIYYTYSLPEQLIKCVSEK